MYTRTLVALRAILLIIRVNNVIYGEVTGSWCIQSVPTKANG